MEKNDVAARDATLEDAERILEIYAYYVEKTAITFEYEVPTLEEFKNRMKKTMEKYPYLVIEKAGKVTPMQALSTQGLPTTGHAR